MVLYSKKQDYQNKEQDLQKVISTPLNKGTIGIFFSKKYIALNAISVAIIKGGKARERSLSFLKYIVKKISKGPKSVKNLTKDLFITKILAHVCIKEYFFSIDFSLNDIIFKLKLFNVY